MKVPNAMKTEDYLKLYPRYIASERSQRKSQATVRSYEQTLRHFAEWLDENDVESVEPLVAQDWVNSLYDRGLSMNSVSLYFGTVERFFGWAVKMKLVKESPMPKERPEFKIKDKTIPTKDEIKKLLDTKPYTLRSKLPIRNYTIVTTILLTGLRSDELRELRLNDLNFEKGYILVRNGKGGKSRKVPFPKRCQQNIREYLASGVRPEGLDDEDYLFGTRHEEGETWHKLDGTTLGRMVHRYGMKVIGKDIHPHLLRHCAASIWDDHDVPMRDVQKALGHSSIATTERIYVHILNDEKTASTVNDALADI